MDSGTVIDLRSTVCAQCGNDGRLIIRTTEAVMSRCPSCGDETTSRVRTPELASPLARVSGEE